MSSGAQLEQHAPRRGRVQERHAMTAGTGPRDLVEEGYPRCLQRGERAVQVLDLEADVVQPGAALVEKPLQAEVSGRRHQLDRCRRRRRTRRGDGRRAWTTKKQDVRLLIGDVLARLLVEAEKALQARAGPVSVANGDGDVIDTLDLDHGDGNGRWRPSAKRVRNLYQPETLGKSGLVWNRFWDGHSTADPRFGLPYDCPMADSVAKLARACGQLLSVGFDGTTAPDQLLRWIADGEVGSVMLFRPNIENPP